MFRKFKKNTYRFHVKLNDLDPVLNTLWDIKNTGETKRYPSIYGEFRYGDDYWFVFEDYLTAKEHTEFFKELHEQAKFGMIDIEPITYELYFH